MKSFLFFLLIAITIKTSAQPVKTPEMLTDSFFIMLSKGSIDKALDYVVSTNPYMMQAKETVDNIKVKLQKSLPLIGKFYGQDLYSKKEIGPNYVYLKYILRYDRQPFIMTFVFYKPDNAWKLQNILFEDKPDKDLDGQPNLVQPTK